MVIISFEPHCVINDIVGLVQEIRNSIANTLELRISYTNPSIYPLPFSSPPNLRLLLRPHFLPCPYFPLRPQIYPLWYPEFPVCPPFGCMFTHEHSVDVWIIANNMQARPCSVSCVKFANWLYAHGAPLPVYELSTENEWQRQREVLQRSPLRKIYGCKGNVNAHVKITKIFCNENDHNAYRQDTPTNWMYKIGLYKRGAINLRAPAYSNIS